MTFFYDLNKRLAALASKQDQQLTESKAAVEESKFSKLAKEIGKNPKVKNPAAVAATIGREKYGQKAMTAKAVAGKKANEEIDEAGYSAKAGRAGKDLGKPGKNFAKIAKGAAERYGSKAAGERVAGAVLNKLRHPKESMAMEGTCPSCNCNPCECVEEGNAFTDQLKKTPKGGKFKVGDKEFTDTSSIEEGFADMDAWLASREKEKGTGKFDRKERTLPGGMKATTYTRRHEEEPIDGDEVKSDAPKKKGRPKGKDKGPERVTAKSYKYKAGRPAKVKEGDMEGSHDRDEAGEFGSEGDYVKTELHTMVRVARDLEKHLRDNEDLPTWCIGKLSQAKGMLVSVMDYIMSEKERGIEASTGEEGITLEKAPPGAKAERMVKHIKKGYSKDGKLTPKEKSIAYATAWKAHNKGQVEEAGKPDFLDIDKDGDKTEPMKQAAKQAKSKGKNKEEKVEETTVAGSVATATTSGKSSKGGMQFGKGVYEGFNNSVEQMITESISVESKMEECGDGNMEPKLVIQADGDEAAKLMMLLKLAGLEGQVPATCPTCGSAPCACDEIVDENKPDWPTNTEVGGENDPTLQMYSGGLNKPKQTKQGTLTGGGLPTMSPRRQVSMEENVELERTLFNTWKNYKG
jgi:hypothetical protein